jgi:hypothetical protein
MVLPHDKRVVAVACHPSAEIVAAGFEDGMVMLARIEDGAEILVRPPGKGAVTGLAWNFDGTRLAYGTEDGAAGIADLS